MNRREFINLAGAVAVGVAGADTLKDLMVKGPSGAMVGDAFAAPIPMNRLNAFAKEVIKRKQHAVGYPINQDLNMKDFYKWFVDTSVAPKYLSTSIAAFMCDQCNNFTGAGARGTA